MDIKIFSAILSIGLGILTSHVASANPKEALDFAKALIESRLQYKRDLYLYFSKPAATAEEETEKLATYRELVEQAGGQTLTSQDVATGFATYRQRYENLLISVFNDKVAKAELDELEKLLTPFPEPYRYSEEDWIRHKVERLYLELWTLRKDELVLRKKNKGIDFSSMEENGYSELTFVQDLMKTIGSETHSWWRPCLNLFEYGSTSEDSPYSSLTNPRFLELATTVAHKIFENAAYKLPLLKEDAPAAIRHTLESYRFNSHLPIHQAYQKAITFQKGLTNKLAKLTENRERAKTQALKNLFLEAEVGLRDFIVKDYTIRMYFLMADYKRLLNQMSSQKEELESFIKLKKKTPRKKAARNARPPSKSTPSPQSSAPPTESKNGDQPQFFEYAKLADQEVIPEQKPGNAKPSDSETNPETLELSDSAVMHSMIAHEESLTTSKEEEEKHPVPLEISTLEIAEEKKDLSYLEPDTDTHQIAIFSKHSFKKLQRNREKQVKDDLAPLRELFSHKTYRELLDLFFDDSRNHLALDFEDIEKLVKRVGGQITQKGTSHCLVVVPGGISHSWRPHKKGHRLKLSGTCVRLFRHAFEMAGITPEALNTAEF